MFNLNKCSNLHIKVRSAAYKFTKLTGFFFFTARFRGSRKTCYRVLRLQCLVPLQFCLCTSFPQSRSTKALIFSTWARCTDFPRRLPVFQRPRLHVSSMMPKTLIRTVSITSILLFGIIMTESKIVLR